MHDNIITLSTNYHVHALDKPSHYDIILHNGHIHHIHNTFVHASNEFAHMNALHIILHILDKHLVPCHALSCRTDSFLHDGHFVCANHCIFECRLCLLFLHVYHSKDVRPSFQSYTNHTRKCVRSRSRTPRKISQQNSRHK